MSKPAVTVLPETSVKEAAQRMIEKKIGCLPVVEGEALVGLVTETDMLRLIAG
jgi:CBS domain-containing protein